MCANEAIRERRKRAAHQRGGSPSGNVVGRRNVTLPHAQSLDHMLPCCLNRLGSISIPERAVEKAKKRRQPSNVRQISLLLGIGTMGLTRWGLETNSRVS